MLFGSTKCQGIRPIMDVPRETIVSVDASGNATYLSLSPSELERVSPLMEIETDLQTLFDANVEPKFVDAANLLTPTNPSTLSGLASNTLSRIATDFENNQKPVSNEKE